MKIFQLVAFILCLNLFSCGVTAPKQETTTSNSEMKMSVSGCSEIVEIINFTHEADCQYLFKMEDGTLLLPADLPVKDDVAFYQGAGLKIGYEVLKVDDKNIAQVSCTKHDYLVKVTCMEQFVLAEKGMPTSHAECVTIKNPYKFNWMRDNISRLQPSRVNEYEYDPGFLYEMQTTEGSYVFDCLGNELCNTKNNTDCKSILESLEKPKVILVVNN